MENQYEKGARGARRPLCIKTEAKRKKKDQEQRLQYKIYQ